MAAIATLVDAPVPPDIAHSAYAPSIVGALAFTPEHRRVVPDAIASKLAVIGDAGAALKRDLDTLVNFLGATFVFDTFANRDERDVVRDHLARTDPVAYAWYQAHFLRQNKLTDVSLALENLADVVAPILTRAINPLEPETVDVSAIVEDLSEDAFIRWRKLEGAPTSIPAVSWASRSIIWKPALHRRLRTSSTRPFSHSTPSAPLPRARMGASATP